MKTLEDMNQLQKFQSKIKLWAKVQIIIAIVAAVFTIIIVTQVSPLIQEKNQLEQTKAKLNDEILQLEKQKENIKKDLRNEEYSLKQAVDLLNKKESIIISDKKKYGDTELKNLITPKTSAVLLNKGSKGPKNYLFKLWIEAPEEVKNKISKVEYFFNHPTFDKKKYSSQKANDNFSVQYDGWGCLSLVVITIFPRDGKSFDIYFDMCAKLGPEWK